MALVNEDETPISAPLPSPGPARAAVRATLRLSNAPTTYVWSVFGLLVLLMAASSPEVELVHKVLGMVLTIACLAPWYWWLRAEHRWIPFFELIGLHYFLTYAPAVFMGPVEFMGMTDRSLVAGPDLTNLLLMLLMGIGCMYVGYYLLRLKRWGGMPRFHLDERRAIMLCLVYLGVSSLGPIFLPRMPGALAKVADILYRLNGSVATYLLSVYMLSGRLSPRQRTAFLVELFLFLALCLASGWLSILAYPILSYFLAEIQVRKRLPWTKIVVAGAIMVAFNMTKTAFREAHWGKGIGGSQIVSVGDGLGRARDWADLALGHGQELGRGTTEMMRIRVNGLSFLGHVFLTTPSPHRHLGMATYDLVPAMFVPRIFWPDKPTTLDASNDIVTRYGWITEEYLWRVALETGIIPEAYIAFGVWGVAVIALLFGVFVRVLTVNLGDPRFGLGWPGILIGLLANGGLMITWTMQSYLAGFWQASLLLALVYAPLHTFRRNS